jgi:hypothetical protein
LGVSSTAMVASKRLANPLARSAITAGNIRIIWPL